MAELDETLSFEPEELGSEMVVSTVFADLQECEGRIRVLEGGARASKTWSIIQSLILYCQDAASRKEKKRITISRKKLTWLKATVIPDFIEILGMYNLYRDANYHKTEQVYTLFGCEIAFIGLDEEQKLHGRRQHIFWINEAVEASYDDFTQLLMRTEEYCILDYNPSFTEHWIFDRVLSRKDSNFIHSTQLDNPFLPEAIRKEILSYDPNNPENVEAGTADENKWKIYGLGQRAQVEGLIYTNVAFTKQWPEVFSKTGIGLDFGFTNDPTACARIGLSDGQIYAKELFYLRGLTNSQISEQLTKSGVGKHELIVADSADPKSIAELKQMGWNIVGAVKGADSVVNGIDILKRFKINIHEDSLNARKEASNYTWRKDRATNTYLNIPVDNWNHWWDAVRYIGSELLSSTKIASRRAPPKRYGRGWRTAM